MSPVWLPFETTAFSHLWTWTEALVPHVSQACCLSKLDYIICHPDCQNSGLKLELHHLNIKLETQEPWWCSSSLSSKAWETGELRLRNRTESMFQSKSKGKNINIFIQFSSVAQLYPTLCDPMDCSTLGLPIHHQLQEFTQTHVHWVGDAIQPSHPLLFPSPPAFNPSQHQGLFQWVSSSHQVAKVMEFQLQNQSFQWIFRTDFL